MQVKFFLSIYPFILHTNVIFQSIIELKKNMRLQIKNEKNKIHVYSNNFHKYFISFENIEYVHFPFKF